MKSILTIAVLLLGLNAMSQKSDYEVRYYEHYKPKWMSTAARVRGLGLGGGWRSDLPRPPIMP
jgi:hypothetical protein